jgi:hypothetical protein
MEECILTYTPRIDDLLEKEYTLIMIAEITFLTNPGERRTKYQLLKVIWKK